MKPLAVIWADLRVLVTDTARVWWRLLPQLLALQIVGWMGYQLSLWLSAAISVYNAWVALVIFSLGFVFTLCAIVLSLRLVGRELGIRALIPQGEEDDDGRDTSVSRLLALTLLPFLGIYAAFNYVTDRADELSVRSLLIAGGVFGSENSLLARLNPTTSRTTLVIVICVVAGTYVVRRVLDLVHERTGWAWLGVVTAAVEGFFLLVLIVSGQRVLFSVRAWLLDRELFSWLDRLSAALGGFFSLFTIDLPEVLDVMGRFLRDTAWPSFLDVMVEPVAWLAVAALVYGSHVLSLAELWRKGEPLSAEVPIPRRLRRVRARKAGSTGVRRAALEVQEALLGDVDDKYLPTLQSIRLILRTGLTFLGAYILIYTLIRMITNLIGTFVDELSGGHQVDYWIRFGSFFDLVETLPSETIRICLLAVAFHRCLLLFKARAADVDTAVLPADVVARAPAEVRS